MEGLACRRVHGYGHRGFHDGLVVDVERVRAGRGQLFSPRHVYGRPRQVTLDRWDKLNLNARITGIGELDDHDTPRRFLGITWSVFPFRKAFRFIRSYFLLENPLRHDKDADIESVYQALRKGRIFVSLDYFKPAHGLSFTVNQDGKELHLGDETAFGLRDRARVNTPYPGRIRLLRNGEIVAQTHGVSLEAELWEKGVYRVEVHNRAYGHYRPWIFSNPIYLR